MSAKRLPPVTRPLVSQKSLIITWKAFEYYAPLKKLFTYVGRHPGEALSLAKAAGIAAMSRTHFSEYFHRNVGVSFKYWNDFVRIQHAATLLRASNSSITEVGQDCGFADSTTFTRTFRRISGMTPAQFRRTCRPAPEQRYRDESPKKSE